MKKMLITFLAFTMISMFGPLALSNTKKGAGNINNTVAANSNHTIITGQESFKVKLNNGKIVTVSAEEYLVGCVAGEMPVNFEDEALKAQAVAAYTFASYKKSIGGKDYDVTADYKTDQCYLTDEELKAKWGANYDENRKRLESIVKSVKGKWISYDGHPILSVYHAISSGVTYSCSEVWGKDLPYLKSVDSSYDKLSEDYKSTLELSLTDFYEKLGINDNIASKPTIKAEKSENGRVISLKVNDKTISGSDFTERLSLYSHNFDCKIMDNSIVFNMFGRGHGVGMSQAGANYLAKSGSTYKEILHHYYSGCSIKD